MAAQRQREDNTQVTL
uniref:Uncharacterized protein n=1 Tax=Anguilla anguilla TaxID=7936 RepID=A0A0E9XIU2_ANGAN